MSTTDSSNTYRMVGIGELLWDLLPEGKQLGGSPMNVVYHCQAAGINSAVISAIGKDALGSEIIDQLTKRSVSTEFVQFHEDKPTGTVTVTLDQGIPDFTIHPDVAWDEIIWNDKLEELAQTVDAVAFGSLPQRNDISRNCILSFLESMKPESLRIFDINIRQDFHSKELINASLSHCNILKINDEELPILANYLNLEGSEEEQLRTLIDHYTLKLIAYTKGAHGSWLITQDAKTEMLAPKIKISDTVGAGDAFTGVMIAGILNGNPLKEIHQKATEVAAWVCTKAGAMPTYE